MASCDTCLRPVMNDGQRCERCQIIGRRRELNLIGEFVAYGWSVSTQFTEESLRAMVFGEGGGGPGASGRYVEFRRCAVPLIPVRSS